MAGELLCSLLLLSSDCINIFSDKKLLTGSSQLSDSRLIRDPSRNPIVTTTYGPIQGYKTQIPGIKDFKFAAVFLGVPYVKPPLGSLRFEKPQPPDPWTTIKQTIAFGEPCSGIWQASGDENCLTLNVFAPIRKNNDTKLLSVYFYIHGGAFIGGSSADMGKDAILTNAVAEDIVVVSINYRLGPLGFLYTEQPEHTPNVGLLDQIAALQWVRDNIDRFGGDPKRVTLSGESAGGASVSWVALSPLSRGLYSQTFPMSGSALNIWASAPDVVKNNTQRLISLGGCQSAQDVLECLKAIPFDQFTKITAEITSLYDEVDFGVWHPVFHESFVGKEVKTIAQAIEKAPVVPHLTAVASQETSNWLITAQGGGRYYPITVEQAAHLTQEGFIASINALYGVNSIFGNHTTEAAASIIKFYTNEAKSYSDYPWVSALAQSTADVLFVIGDMREALHRAKIGAPVYFFLNECVGRSSPVVAGCPHGSISFYLFNEVTPRIQQQILPAIIRFIKTGEPWKGYRVTPTNIPYFHASLNGGFSDSLWPKRVNFWNQFYDTFGYDWPSGQRDRP